MNYTNNGYLNVEGNMNISKNLTVNNSVLFANALSGRVSIGQLDGLDPRIGLTVKGDIDINHTATESNDHILELDIDAAGFGDVKGIDIVYTTGAISSGLDEGVIFINIDESTATGGSVIGLEILGTEGSASLYGMEAGALVNPIFQLSGIFEDMDSAFVAGVDRLTEFKSTSSDISIFVSDNDNVTIGNSVKFEEIEFLFDTTASNPGIKPIFEYSTGVGTWATFSPTDGTNGLRNNGVIAWSDGDIPTWATGAGSEYIIRITRTQNNLNTIPIEDKVQISSVTEYKWNKDGDILIREINSTLIRTDNITSGDWINVSITESQISDLVHTVDTNITNCSVSGSCDNLCYLNYDNANGLRINGSIQSGAPGFDGNISIYSNTTGYMVNVVTSSTQSMNTNYTLPADIPSAPASGVNVLTTDENGVMGWSNIPTTVVYNEFGTINISGATNIVADSPQDTLTIVSNKKTITFATNPAKDKLILEVNQTSPFNFTAAINFTNENVTIPHTASEPSRAIDGTKYQNTDVRTRMVYGSVQFIVSATSSAYCEAFTDSAAVPTTRHQIFGPASWVPAVAQTRVDVHSFFFVVQPGDYYHINQTTSGGGTATLLEWHEVML
jgi:hypothetical protein